MPGQQVVANAVKALDAIEAGDSECGHQEADQIILGVLRDSGMMRVVEAYEAVKKRATFYYA